MPNRAARRCARAFLVVGAIAAIAACTSSPSQQSFVPANAPASVPFRALSQDAGDDAAGGLGDGTLVLRIVVPAHGPLVPPHGEQSNWVSPATNSLTVTTKNLTTKKMYGPVFYSLSPSTYGCSGGIVARKGATPLKCSFSLSLPAGETKIFLAGYSTKNATGDALSEVQLQKAIHAGRTTSLGVSLNGVVRYVIAWLSDPFPSLGVRGTEPVHILAADAWGYVIVGKYDSPIHIDNTDSSGVTSLSQTQVTSSHDKVSLYYNGGVLKKAPSMLAMSMPLSSNKIMAVHVPFDPGYSVLLALPTVVLVNLDEPRNVRMDGMLGTIPPYKVTTGPDPYGDQNCNGIVALGGTTPHYTVHAMQIGACSLFAGDRAGHRIGIPTLVQQPNYDGGTPPPSPSPTPSASPSPTPTSAPTHSPTPAPTSTPGVTPTPAPTATIPVTIPTPTPAPTSPPVFGTPFFVNGGSGNCATQAPGITLNGIAAIADILMSEPGYSGTLNAQSSNTSVATASIANNILTVTAQSAGTTTVSVADVVGNTSYCDVTVL